MENVILYYEKNTCCGCTACTQVCSQEAITMEADQEGFLYPKVNTHYCVNCRKCLAVCIYKAHLKERGKAL